MLRVAWCRQVLSVLLGLLVSLASLGTEPRAASSSEVDQARGWMAQNGIEKSSLAIGRSGTILRAVGQKRSPDTPYPLASLSKAVTGMCMNQVLADTPYTWDSTMTDLAPEFAKMNFTPATQMRDLTLNQVATHTSGLPVKLNYGNMSARNTTLSSQPTMARAALKEPENFGPRGVYVYSNANYAVLGFLIEAMTGQPYGDICKTKIMIPAGATKAGVMDRMSKTAAYGGWSASVEDYARFAMFWFDPAQPWMQDPSRFAFDEAAGYGMGASVRQSKKGVSITHFGRWTHIDPRKPNIGALFFVQPDGTTVVANWERSLEIPLYRDLLHALRKAL
jgi:CubicO group peptidase (beta-lactamase class C family)